MNEVAREIVEPPFLFDIVNGVAWLTLNRPRYLNALNTDLAQGCLECCDRVVADDRIRSFVITGAGRGFCSGADVRGLIDDPAISGERSGDTTLEHSAVQTFTSRLFQMPKPVIAAVNGPAVGAGFEFSLVCDVRLMAESAYFQQAALRHGLVPGDGSVSLLPKMIGLGRSMDLLLTERRVSAADAVALGLAREVVPDGELPGRAQELAEQLGALDATGVALTKQAVRMALGGPDLDTVLAQLRLAVAHGKVVQRDKKRGQ
jgi:2-(1,2-epoxy-1,2-dihydrophenyl)acetyl-CoA isomerase